MAPKARYTPWHPSFKRNWCNFHWRSHHCRNGEECNHAHSVEEYLGPPDFYTNRHEESRTGADNVDADLHRNPQDDGVRPPPARDVDSADDDADASNAADVDPYTAYAYADAAAGQHHADQEYAAAFAHWAIFGQEYVSGLPLTDMNDPERNPWEGRGDDNYQRGARWADNIHHADPAQDVDPHVQADGEVAEPSPEPMDAVQADPLQGVAPSVHADPPQGVAPSVHADSHVSCVEWLDGARNKKMLEVAVSCVEWLDGARRMVVERDDVEEEVVMREEVVERDDVEEEDERDDAEDEKKEDEEGDVITAAWFHSDEPDWDGLRCSRLWIAFSAKIMIKAARDPSTVIAFWDAPRLMLLWGLLLQQTDHSDLQKEEEADLQKEEEAAQIADLQREEEAAAEVMDPADLQKEEEAAHAAWMVLADLQQEEEITWLAEAAAEVMDPEEGGGGGGAR